MRWFGNEISGAAGATHRIPDALYEEFNAQYSALPGLTWIAQDETTALTPASIVATSLTATTAHFKGEPWYDVKAYGAAGDGTTDDRAAFQVALNAVTASGKPGTIVIPRGTYKISSPGITADASYHSIRGFNAILNASSMTTGAAITIRGSVDTPYIQATQSYEGFRIVGPGMTTGTASGLILTESTTIGIGPSHISFSNLVVQDFATAMKFGTGAYTISVISSNFFSNGTCLYTDSTVFNGGQQMSFFGTRFHSSNLALEASNANAGFFFSACSFDYNAKQFNISGTKVYLANCHVEAGKTTYTSTPITLAGDGGTFIMFGGWLLQTGASAATNGYVVDTTASGGLALFDGVFINNSQTSTGLFATGTGEVILKRCQSNATSLNPQLLSSVASLLADGGFEQTTVRDDVFVYIDTAAITSRTDGANIDLSTSTAQARTGSRSLRFDKVGGAFSDSDFIIAAPVRHGSHPAARLYYRKPGAETGTMFVDTAFARLGVNGSGVPVVLHKAASIASVQVTFTSAAVGWTEVVSAEPTERTPAWATHFIIIFNLTQFVGPGAVYFDDVLITEM